MSSDNFGSGNCGTDSFGLDPEDQEGFSGAVVSTGIDDRRSEADLENAQKINPRLGSFGEQGSYNSSTNHSTTEIWQLAWSYCRAALRKSLESHFFEGYIAPLELRAVELIGAKVANLGPKSNPCGGDPQSVNVKIAAPSRFVVVQIERSHKEQLVKAFIEALSQLEPVFSASGISASELPILAEGKSFTAGQIALEFEVDSSLLVKFKRTNSKKAVQTGEQFNYGAGDGELAISSSNLSSEERMHPEKLSSRFDAPVGHSGSVSSSDNATSAQTDLSKPPFVKYPQAPSYASTLKPSIESIKASGINPKYTFSTFVVGNSNEFGHAAAMRVAEQPGKSYNPLFIYGGVGLGKTHLLHAIANTVLGRNPKAHVLYMSSETFTNELINSLRTEKMNDFKNRLRSVEVLLIDDIQFLCGKERTQEEFFHTFNALYAARHQIVVTSDKLPQEIPGIEERLQTRFSWGLTADLQAPDFETRVAILKRKAAVDGIDLPEEVSNLIAQNISSNVRELEGALTRLHALCSLRGSTITLDSAQSALKPLLAPKSVHVSVDDIKKSVSNFFNIKVSEIIAKKRTRNLSYPRHIAMYLCRKHTTLSYPEIGENFGGRDHSSVIHASNVIATKVAHDPDTRQLVTELERRLLGHSFITH